MNILSFSKKVGTTTICSGQPQLLKLVEYLGIRTENMWENEIKDLKQTVVTEILETSRGQGKAIPVQA